MQMEEIQSDLLHLHGITLKRKKILLENSLYYVEDVRKDILDKFGYDKVYKEGLNIKTPLDLNLQTIATEALRDGLIAYDKRKGWRGPLENKVYNERVNRKNIGNINCFLYLIINKGKITMKRNITFIE